MFKHQDSREIDRLMFGAFITLLTTRLHEYLFRLTLTQCEIVAAHFDFHRITHRGKADEFHFCSDEQPHFHEARAAGWREVDFGDGHRCAQGDRSQWLDGRGHVRGNDE